MNRGKLVVIEGTDGAGKGTQAELLIEYCKTNTIPYASFDFPQYYKTFFGKWIGRYMKGEFGPLKEVPPYVITIPYAADRWQAKPEIEQALTDGKLVILNRYATSNAAYQGAKLPVSERQAFIDWNFTMEYKEFGIPKEDLVIYLHVPVTTSQQLIEQKHKRDYLDNGLTKDIHESDIELLKNVEEVYEHLSKTFPHWETIECTNGETLISKEDIHLKIKKILTTKRYI